MSCTTCHTKTKDQRYEQVLKNATAYASEKKIPVAIYEEAGEWKYIDAFEAYRQGFPVRDVVSNHSGTATE